MYPRRTAAETGFTLFELAAVCAVLATVVLIAVPVYLSARGLAQRRTCFQNQNTIERSADLYMASRTTGYRADLAGVLTKDHPLVIENVLARPPLCPAGTRGKGDPTVADGAYQFDENGELMACGLGAMEPHGSFTD